MMNFIISLCKITSSSKIFSRNFYLPLLKPATPKDALRTFKITGKWLLGPKRQHYIPVLLKHDKKRSETSCKDYGKKIHRKAKNYSYLTPILDVENNENHRTLQEILEKEVEEQEEELLFVYTIEDKKINVILPFCFERAIRRGDIIDVLLSQRNDRILFKLKENKVPVEVTVYEQSQKDVLYKGEGATTVQEEENHHHGKYTMSIAQYFEDKERKEEEWEKELKKMMETKKKQKGEGSKEWNEMIKDTKSNLDWKQIEKEARKVIEFINEPIVEQFIPMEVDNIESTTNVNEILQSDDNKCLMDMLPKIGDIPELMRSLENARLADENCPISGVFVKLLSGREVFVPGQKVYGEDGDVFVPGQSLENEFGLEFVPGITVNLEGKSTLINGLIVGEKETNKPTFVTTEATITDDGNLSFTTTKEDRTKYAPINVHRIKNTSRKTKKKKKVVKKEEEQEQEEAIVVMTNVVNEEEKKIEKKKEEKPKRKKNVIISKKRVEKDINNNNMEDNFYPDLFNSIESEENDSTSEELLDVAPIDLENYSELERFLMKTMDDRIDKIISSVEMKKSEIKSKLLELQQLNSLRHNNIIYLATEEDAQRIARIITSDEQRCQTLQDILLTLTHKLIVFPSKSSIKMENVDGSNILDGFSETFSNENYKKCREKVKLALKTSMVAANNALKTRPKDELTVLKTIGTVLLLSMKQDGSLIADLCDIMSNGRRRNDVSDQILRELSHQMRENKIKMLRHSLKNRKSFDLVYENLSEILKSDSDVILKRAFVKIARNEPILIERIIDLINQKSHLITTDQWAYDVTRDAVLKSVQHFYETQLENALINSDDLLFAQAHAIADILNMTDCLETSFTNHRTVNLFKRVLIMRKLSENDKGLRAAMDEITKNPTEFIKTNPRLMQLLKESAILIYNRVPMRNSKEITNKLIEGDRFLLEDYLLSRGITYRPVMVAKNAKEIVIPREKEREVKKGIVSYVLIDEDGVIRFKPAHMFNNEKEEVDSMRRGSLNISLFPKDKEDEKTNEKLNNKIRRMSQVNHRMVA